MNEQQVRQIAEAAFKARFGDIDIVGISVKPFFGMDDEPMLDVRIVYDAELERLLAGDHMGVRSEVIDKVWEEPEDSPVWPQVHFIAKSDIDRRQQQTAA